MAAAPALAQAPPDAPSTKATPAPAGCTPSSPTANPPGVPGSTTGAAQEPLTDKLARSDGVLCPPAGVDPAIRAPTPDAGATTPVIPPPGSPGGDQSVRPK